MLRPALILLALLAALPAQAHHGWSGYDSSKLVTLDGTVQQVNYGNPHVLIMLRTGGAEREIVLAPPSRMVNRGLPEGSIRAEQAVSVQGYPHLKDEHEFRAERIVIDGKTFELR